MDVNELMQYTTHWNSENRLGNKNYQENLKPNNQTDLQG